MKRAAREAMAQGKRRVKAMRKAEEHRRTRRETLEKRALRAAEKHSVKNSVSPSKEMRSSIEYLVALYPKSNYPNRTPNPTSTYTL